MNLFAQTFSDVNTMVSVLGTDINTVSTNMKTQGFTVQTDPAVPNRNIRLVVRQEQRGSRNILVEYCGSTVTGYYTALTKTENIILLDALMKANYNEGEYREFKKADVTVKLVSDYSL